MAVLPVTVVSGFVGAGKTALIEHLLNSRPDLRIAVIVNDTFDESASSASSVTGDGSTGDTVRVRMSEGCICCSMREDLLEEIARLAAQESFDYLLVEAGGTSHPLPIAELFAYVDQEGRSLSDVAQLDTLVAVVDAENFLADFQSDDELLDRGLAEDEDDDQDVSQVLSDQVEFANVIVMNKVDLIDEAHRKMLRSFLEQLNPRATVIETQHGRVDPAAVISTGQYSPEWVFQVAGDPGDDLSGDQQKLAEQDEQEMCTIAYRSRRPFHPARFYDFWMTDEMTFGIMRSRGFFWLATRCGTAGYWSQTGRVLSPQPAGPWWAESPREEWPIEDEEMLSEIESVWDPTWGDRRQELKILLRSEIADDVVTALNSCLLTDDEMAVGPENWQQMDDPFESWEHVDEGHESHDHDCSRDHDRG